MKTKEELNALKEEVENLSKKLADLTEEELTQVSGGVAPFEQLNGNLVGRPWAEKQSSVSPDSEPIPVGSSWQFFD